jgi:hypothetical protein
MLMPWVHSPNRLRRLHKIVRFRHPTLGQDHFTPYNTPLCRRLIILTRLLSPGHRLTNRSTLTLRSSSANMTLVHPTAAIIQLPTLGYDRSSLTMRIPIRQSVLPPHIPHLLNIRKTYHLRYATVRWFVLPVSRRVVNITLATNPSSGNHTIQTLLRIDQNG